MRPSLHCSAEVAAKGAQKGDARAYAVAVRAGWQFARQRAEPAGIPFSLFEALFEGLFEGIDRLVVPFQEFHNPLGQGCVRKVAQRTAVVFRTIAAVGVHAPWAAGVKDRIFFLMATRSTRMHWASSEMGLG
jgi:hypothetical protein